MSGMLTSNRMSAKFVIHQLPQCFASRLGRDNVFAQFGQGRRHGQQFADESSTSRMFTCSSVDMLQLI